MLSHKDYRSFLRLMANHADWETLPSTLQYAIDHLLCDEAEAEPGAPKSLRELLAETGD